MGCNSCNGTGKSVCPTCGGGGKGVPIYAKIVARCAASVAGKMFSDPLVISSRLRAAHLLGPAVLAKACSMLAGVDMHDVHSCCIMGYSSEHAHVG